MTVQLSRTWNSVGDTIARWPFNSVVRPISFRSQTVGVIVIQNVTWTKCTVPPLIVTIPSY